MWRKIMLQLGEGGALILSVMAVFHNNFEEAVYWLLLALYFYEYLKEHKQDD